MSYVVTCDFCGEDILPTETLLEYDMGRLRFHDRPPCQPPEDGQGECEACEAERRDLPGFDITSGSTGSYCDGHAGEHSATLEGRFCANCGIKHKEGS